jgi:hypothetical protein
VETGTLTIDGGIINVPRGNALSTWGGTLVVITPGTIDGATIEVDSSRLNVRTTLYGQAVTETESELISLDDDEVFDSVVYTITNGAVWTIDSVTSDLENTSVVTMNIESGGRVDLQNTRLKFEDSLTVETGAELNIDANSSIAVIGGTVINEGVITNSGAFTVPLGSSLTNNNTINNAATGRIINEGTIVNTGGTIDNEGTFKSVQSKEVMGGTIDGEVLPYPDPAPSPDPDPAPNPNPNPDPDPNTPPSAESDNTIVEIEFNPDGDVVAISVKTENGTPIPSGVLFKVWMWLQNNQSLSNGQSVSAKAEPAYIGPFVVESKEGALKIDVNNLKKPDGTKASIKAGSYVVRFADDERKYVGTTEPLAFEGTGTAADTDAVRIISDYGLIADVSGNTVTVTGSVSTLASDVLELGDISGLVIDWKADLTVTGGSRPSKGFGMINFSSGEFNLTGGTIQLPFSANTWIEGIHANGDATVRVAGGKLKGDRAKDTGINVEDGVLIIDSGEVSVPRGNMLFARTLRVNDPSVLNGVALTGTVTNYTLTVYGYATTVPDSELFYEKYDPEDDRVDSISYVIPNGAVWDIEGVQSDMTAFPSISVVNMTVRSGGVANLTQGAYLKFKGRLTVEEGGILYIEKASGLEVTGTMTINGSAGGRGARAAAFDPDNGVLDNSGTFTLTAGSKLTNNGIINNASTGTMINKGTIDNTNGTIDNEGTFKSVQSEEEMGGEIYGEVQPDGPRGGTSSSSSGGCDAGYGLFSLLLAGLVTRKYRKA